MFKTFGFGSFGIRICFGFRVSSFEFIFKLALVGPDELVT
jgi:hypothetical protein